MIKIFSNIFSISHNTDEEGKIVAKFLIGNSMDYMFSDQANRQGLCPVCHNLLEQIPDLNAKIKSKKGDLFITCDGFTLVSQKFKDFCEYRNYPNLTFKEMTNIPGLYYFKPNDVFRIDTTNIKFFNYKECCKSFDYIIDDRTKKEPKFVITTDDFINRTNILYGGQQCKFHAVVVGLKTAKLMKDYGLQDIHFGNIYE